MSDLRAVYDRTDYEVVRQSPYLKIPVSTAAVFTVNTEIDADELQTQLERREYAFISPFQEGAYFSSKVYDGETNQCFHLKTTQTTIRLFPKSHVFSFTTFERIVGVLEETLECELVYEPSDD